MKMRLRAAVWAVVAVSRMRKLASQQKDENLEIQQTVSVETVETTTAATTGSSVSRRPFLTPRDFSENSVGYKLSSIQRLFVTFEFQDASILSQIIFSVIILAIILGVFIFILSGDPQYNSSPATCDSPACINDALLCPGRVICEPQPPAFFDTIDEICVIIFTIDYMIRLLTCWSVPKALAGISMTREQERRPYYSTIMHVCLYMVKASNLIDICAILPFYVALGLPAGSSGSSSFVRVLRLARLLRLLKLSKHNRILGVLTSSFVESTMGLTFTFFFMGIATILIASVMFLAEQGTFTVTTDYPNGAYMRPTLLGDDDQKSPFQSISVSIYYTIITQTTVGYGEIYPTSIGGRAVACMATFLGIVLLALPISILGTSFTNAYMKYIEQLAIEREARDAAIAAARRLRNKNKKKKNSNDPNNSSSRVSSSNSLMISIRSLRSIHSVSSLFADSLPRHDNNQSNHSNSHDNNDGDGRDSHQVMVHSYSANSNYDSCFLDFNNNAEDDGDEQCGPLDAGDNDMMDTDAINRHITIPTPMVDRSSSSSIVEDEEKQVKIEDSFPQFNSSTDITPRLNQQGVLSRGQKGGGSKQESGSGTTAAAVAAARPASSRVVGFITDQATPLAAAAVAGRRAAGGVGVAIGILDLPERRSIHNHHQATHHHSHHNRHDNNHHSHHSHSHPAAAVETQLEKAVSKCRISLQQNIDKEKLESSRKLRMQLSHKHKRRLAAQKLASIPWIAPRCYLYAQEEIKREYELNLLGRAFMTLEDSNSSMVGRAISLFMVTVICLSVACYIMSTIAPDFVKQPSVCDDPVCLNDPTLCPHRAVCEPRAVGAFDPIDEATVIIFTVEFCCRFFLCWAVPRRLAGLLPDTWDEDEEFDAIEDSREPHKDPDPFSWYYQLFRYLTTVSSAIDIVAIVPFYIGLGLGGGNGNSFSFVRVLRLARVMRLLKLLKRNEYISVMSKTMSHSLPALSIMIFIVILAVIFFGSIAFIIEQGTFQVTADYPQGAYLRATYMGGDSGLEQSPFRSIGVSIYWAVVTSTTMGYGDLYPTSIAGRAIACITAFFGILALALPISVIGGFFLMEYRKMLDIREKISREEIASFLAAELATVGLPVEEEEAVDPYDAMQGFVLRYKQEMRRFNAINNNNNNNSTTTTTIGK